MINPTVICIENAVNKIAEIRDEVKKIKVDEKVVVMHLTLGYELRDFITRYQNIQDTYEGFMLNGEIQVYFSNYLPKLFYSVITRSEYEELKSKDLL